jgi:trehalose/maltose transport system permease protein
MTTQPSATGVAQAPPQARSRHGRAGASLSEGARAERRLGWLLCAPAVVIMLAVTAYPIGYAIWLSLQRYDLRFPAERQFIGLANYATVLGDSLWWMALGVTLFITVVSVAVELVLGMGLALMMRWALLGRAAVRTAILIPYGIVTVVAAYSWQYAWTPGIGYLAAALPSGSAPLTRQWPAIFIIIGAEIWKTTPFMALLLLAGLSLVSEDLLKAAKVDGASAWQRFTQIMLPLMKPAILVALLFRVLDAFRVFDNIFILTAGANNTRSVSILGYDNLFTALNLGGLLIAAIIVFLFVLAVAFAAQATVGLALGRLLLRNGGRSFGSWLGALALGVLVVVLVAAILVAGGFLEALLVLLGLGSLLLMARARRPQVAQPSA